VIWRANSKNWEAFFDEASAEVTFPLINVFNFHFIYSLLLFYVILSDFIKVILFYLMLFYLYYLYFFIFSYNLYLFILYLFISLIFISYPIIVPDGQDREYERKKRKRKRKKRKSNRQNRSKPVPTKITKWKDPI
jgi:hypothetical protein